MLPLNRVTIHPGIVLNELYVNPRNMTLDQLTEQTGIDTKLLWKLLLGRGDFTKEIAQKIAEVTNTSTEFWMNLQENHNETIRTLDEKKEKVNNYSPKRSCD